MCHPRQVLADAVVEEVEAEAHQACLLRPRWHQRLSAASVQECLLAQACQALVDRELVKASPTLLARLSRTSRDTAEDKEVQQAALASQAWPVEEEQQPSVVLEARPGSNHNSHGRGFSLLPCQVLGFNSRLLHSNCPVWSLPEFSWRC